MKPRRGLFARVSLDYADHPKIAELSDAAFRLHITMILYARKYQTDGVIKKRVANRLANQLGNPTENRLGSDSVSDPITELLTNDDESPSLVESENGDYLLHDYAEMQETKAEIDALKARNSANGAKGGRPKTQPKTQSVSDSVSDSVSESGTQTKAELEGELEGELEVNKTPPSPPRGGARKRAPRATRLPDGWEPPEEFVVEAQRKFPNVDLRFETEKFADYWQAKSGQAATKVDWGKTWRNWMRNASERAPRVMAGSQGHSRGTRTEDWLRSEPPAQEAIDVFEYRELA